MALTTDQRAELTNLVAAIYALSHDADPFIFMAALGIVCSHLIQQNPTPIVDPVSLAETWGATLVRDVRLGMRPH